MVLVAVTPDDCEFYTPQFILDKVYRCFDIDIDPCTPVDYHNVIAKTHYNKFDDGLNKSWNGNLFFNPPYGRFISKWIDKFIDELKEGNVRNAILLVPNKTETKWFNKIAESCNLMCTIIHRLPFDNPEHIIKNGTFGSSLFLFTDSPTIRGRFIFEFQQIGVIWKVIK